MSADLDPEIPGKAPAEAMALRAKPRPVTRLSKRSLALLLGGASVLVLGGAIWALRPPAKPEKAAELYSTDRHATAEGLNGLPKDYLGVTPPAAGPPQLGPPLPGDLGGPILRAQAEGRMGQEAGPTMGGPADPARDQSLQAELKARQDAIGSPLFSASDRGRPAIGEAAGSGAPPADAAALIGALTQAGTSSTATPAVATPSRQEAFLSARAEVEVVSAHRLQAPASPYAVLSGTMIAAALVTGLDSDLPGQVVATVTAPVFDTVTGRILLIPQGARLLGTYDSQTRFGDSRALVVWTRLLLPNGRSVILDRQSAVDAQGFAGLSDQVDHHWRRLIGGAAVSTLLGVGAELATPQSEGRNGQVVIAARDGVQDSVNQVGQELTRRNLDIKPTLKVRPGFQIRMLVSKDLVLEPYL